MTGAYYNEVDPFAAEWLRNLIKAGHIAPGEVDERDIREVVADDVKGFTQCHFFAGIGGWSHALRLAGWPDDEPVWTGSCPCQPFSAAGQKRGFDDSRHLWPQWFRLIRECHPRRVFGEQVASKDVLPWLDLVWSNLEIEGYAVGSGDLCAAGVGAPHIRQRLYFVADSVRLRRAARRAGHGDRQASGGRSSGELADTDGRDTGTEGQQRGGQHGLQSEDGRLGGMADTACQLGDRRGYFREGRWCEPADGRFVGDPAGAGSLPGALDGLYCGEEGAGARHVEPERPGATRGLAIADGVRREREDVPVRQPRQGEAAPIERGSNFWSAVDWIACTDGKARPVEPGTFPLAHGVPARVGRLRAYGNAIVPQVAAEFIKSFLEVAP